MLLPKRSRSIASSIVLSALAASALLNYPSISAHSSSPALPPRRSGNLVQGRADSSGPLVVTPNLDSPRAASAVITAGGGTLTATAANGAVFTLTIPKDALLDQEIITMTPVAAIPDLPLGGGLAGGGAVQFAPQGLILMETATLVIQPASPISFDQQSPFSWVNAGDDFHLFPLTLDLTTITLNIDHLDGYGIGSGSSADREATAAYQPGRIQARREQNVEIAVETARDKLQGGLTKKQQKKAIKALNAAISDLLQADLTLILAELVQKTINNDQRPQVLDGTSLLCGLFDLLKLMRSQDELAVPLPSDIVATASYAVQTLMSQYFNDCQQNVLSVGSLISLARVTRALAASDSRLAGLSSLVPEIMDKANSCAKLTLEFNSHIQATYPYGTYMITMHSDVPLTFDAKNNMFTGQAPMIHALFYVIPKTFCTAPTSYQNDTCRVYLKLGNLIVTDCDSNTAYPKDYDLYLDIGAPMETIEADCPFVPPLTNSGPLWGGQFECSHQADYYTGLYRIQGWTRGDGDVLASKEYEGVLCSVNPFDEDTTIELHRQ